ncbi:MAG: hypothetical protein HY538_08150 [Deltaproteobacteria bacterium]|nr:hypothetical protein [Deltaproteobacteria bacterium]
METKAIIVAILLCFLVQAPLVRGEQPEPDDEGDYLWWDGGYNMLVRPVGKLFDLGRPIKTVGRWLRLRGRDEALNVNALDEVEDSSWFTNRHEKYRMSLKELQRGANSDSTIDTQNVLEIVAGKSLGITPGLIVKDSKGDRYLLKFDPPDYPGMATSAEMVSSRFMHAAGYPIPEYAIATIDPTRLTIKEGAKIKGRYNVPRPMVQSDVEDILKRVYVRKDGKIRASASKFLDGIPMGSPTLVGVRKDDPDDTIPHQHLRELRGLRIVSSFLNNTDCRRGNYLDMYVNEGEQWHIKHYILDLSSTVGSGNTEPKSAKYGNEYVVDPPKISLSYITLGFWIKPWENGIEVRYPETGTFESEIFHPKRWVTSYPNAGFVEMTPRDAFWGAKIVTAFTDNDIRAIVETGQFSNPEAEEYVVKTFIERRDKIGRYWFDTQRMNPLSEFRVIQQKGSSMLQFNDIAIDRDIATSMETRYRYQIDKESKVVTVGRSIPIGSGDPEIRIWTSRDSGEHWGKKMTIRIENGSVVSIER